MPEIRYYTVTEEREVKVCATSPIDAARLADADFHGVRITDDVEGATTTPIRVRDITVREDY